MALITTYRDAKQVDWVKSFTALLEELRKYVMEYHTTGLTWNPKASPCQRSYLSTTELIYRFFFKGGNPMTYTAAGAQPEAAAASRGPPPPPPPPPPPAAPPAAATSSAAAVGGTDALFAELNKGEGVTSGLRKVNKEEMTHKNPALRASGTVPASPAASSSSAPVKRPSKPSKPTALAGKKPSKMALEGNKWNVVSWPVLCIPRSLGLIL